MTQRIIDPVLNIFIGTSPSLYVARHLERDVSYLPRTDRDRITTLLIDTMRLQNSGQNGYTYGADVMQIQTPRYERNAEWTVAQAHNMYIKANSGPHKPGISVAGAGGIRNNGHVALCSLATSIEQRIKSKLSQIIAPPLEGQTEQAINGLRINIITFLGGGTGSGILPALSVIARTVANARIPQPHTAIYAVLPEQPRGLTEEMRRRQRSNALATLMELTAILQAKDQKTSDALVLGNLNIDISALQVVDVVYLYGHGLLTEHQEIYQLIAMDLFLRIQDGHGAGFERKRQLPDLSALKNMDSRKLPTCFATSGVAEIVFPRAELISAWAHAAARSMVNNQIGQVNDYSEEDRFADEQAVEVLNQIDNKITALVSSHRPAEFDSDIVDDGEDWHDKVVQHHEDFGRKLAQNRTTLVGEIEEQMRQQMDRRMQKVQTAIQDRTAHIYDEIGKRLKTVQEASSIPEPDERNQTFEERVFNPGFLDRWRKLEGAFVDYANDILQSKVETEKIRFRRGVLQELHQRCSQASYRERLELDQSRKSAIRLSDADRALLEEGKLPYTHRYNRMALPNRELIDTCYFQMLRELKLGDETHGLDVNRVFEEIAHERKTREEKRQSDSKSGLSRGNTRADTSVRSPYDKYTDFFIGRFNSYFNPRGVAQPLVEIILEVGGEQLLRTHFRWGLEWALGHLDYNCFQEPQTYGRVVRQLDVAVNFAQRDDLRKQIQQIIDQESSRSEIQNNLKLLDAADPDRLSFLYSEYGIPLRAINGMHESEQSSYLKDYIESQTQWSKDGSIPPHSSDYMEHWVAKPIDGHEALIQRLADDQSIVKLVELYPRIAQNGQHP